MTAPASPPSLTSNSAAKSSADLKSMFGTGDFIVGSGSKKNGNMSLILSFLGLLGGIILAKALK
jgi:hypothetical protein